jgi:DegV family protein with EDD domain
MNKVAIMTDTIACVPQEMAKEYGIKVVPYHAILDGKSYLDTEVNMGKLYARLKEKENLPTTSFPSSEEFLQAYLELSPRAEAILYISMTSAFSAGYKAAMQAKEIVQERLPETKIEVIDSYTLESGELLIVTEAARAAREGKNLDEIVALVNEMIRKINLLQATDTLFYRDKGGRIFEAKSWAEAESATSFKAILEVDAFTGGITKPIARAKTKKQLIETMVNIAKERMGNKKFHAAIVHTNVLEQAEQLKGMLLSQCHCDEPHIGEASVMSAIHNGEGFISFGFYDSD